MAPLSLIILCTIIWTQSSKVHRHRCMYRLGVRYNMLGVVSYCMTQFMLPKEEDCNMCVLLVQTVVRCIPVDPATTKQEQVVPAAVVAIPKVVVLVQTVVRRIPVDRVNTQPEHRAVAAEVVIPKVVVLV